MSGSGPYATSDETSEELKEVIAVMEQSFLHMDALKRRIEYLESKEWKVWPEVNEKFESWVNEWLLPTFRLEVTLGTDWADDPAIFSELAALFAGYTEMVSSDASGWDPLTWHSHKTGTIERITTHQRLHPTATPSVSGWADHSSP